MATRQQDGISRNLGSTVGRRKLFVSIRKPPEWLLIRTGLSNRFCRLLLEGVKWPRREANHSSPSSAEAKNSRIYTSTPPLSCKLWFSIKHAGITSHYSPLCKKCAWAQDGIRRLARRVLTYAPEDIILSRSVTLLEKEHAGRRRDFTVRHFLHPLRARSVKDSAMESTNRPHRHL